MKRLLLKLTVLKELQKKLLKTKIKKKEIEKFINLWPKIEASRGKSL